MTVVARNPVVRGSSPDPSICRVGAWYLLATSTFEWYPGVRLHGSRDLAHWQVIGHALDAGNGFDLRGVPDSGGVWAPSLTVVGDELWLATAIVRSMDGDDIDAENILVTAPILDAGTADEPPRIGRWSAPIALGSRGFDFSFFHDDDGRHWLVGVQWDHRPGRTRFSGIVLEEYLVDARRMSGDPVVILRDDALVEGPNLYRNDGWYVLLLAEGGTGWNHGVTMARARSITGPYERDPAPAVLTRRDLVGHELQKAGHGELVRLPDGGWAMVHLASRPVVHGGARFSTLGRETCVQRVVFDDDGWLRLADGGHHGSLEVALPLAPAPTERLPELDDFDDARLDLRRWSTLRVAPDPARFDLGARPGWLRLAGGPSTASVFAQSMLAQRVTEPFAGIVTRIDADPATPRQAAGLIAWYDRHAHLWLRLGWDEGIGRHVSVVERDRTATTASPAVSVGPGPVRMRLRIDGALARFDVATGDEPWTAVPGVFDAWKLSDDHGDRLRFTGMVVGVRAEDLDGTGWYADVDLVAARFEERPSAALSDRPEAARVPS